jgi:hypothetical protein
MSPLATFEYLTQPLKFLTWHGSIALVKGELKKFLSSVFMLLYVARICYTAHNTARPTACYTTFNCLKYRSWQFVTINVAALILWLQVRRINIIINARLCSWNEWKIAKKPRNHSTHTSTNRCFVEPIIDRSIPKQYIEIPKWSTYLA